MTDNENRRGARRQQRGLQRQADILHTAGLIFDEVGYGDTTTNAIAARLAISPGSLYQYFPNKEAIADALANRYTDDLQAEWDKSFSPEIATLPLKALADLLVNKLIAFNQTRPGFTVLFFGDDISPKLAAMGDELHQGILIRFGDIIALRAPHIPPDQRHLIADVIMKIHKAFIPGLLTSDDAYQQRLIVEMKAVLYGYLALYLSD